MLLFIRLGWSGVGGGLTGDCSRQRLLLHRSRNSIPLQEISGWKIRILLHV